MFRGGSLQRSWCSEKVRFRGGIVQCSDVIHRKRNTEKALHREDIDRRSVRGGKFGRFLSTEWAPLTFETFNYCVVSLELPIGVLRCIDPVWRKDSNGEVSTEELWICFPIVSINWWIETGCSNALSEWGYGLTSCHFYIDWRITSYTLNYHRIIYIRFIAYAPNFFFSICTSLKSWNLEDFK